MVEALLHILCGIDIIHGHRIPVDSIDGLCRMLKL